MSAIVGLFGLALSRSGSYSDCLAEYERSWGARGLCSPTVLARPDAALSFGEEYRLYRERVPHQRNASDEGVIALLAESLGFPAECAIVCGLLAHASEPIDCALMAAQVSQFVGVSGHVVCFVHAHAGEYGRPEFEARSLEIRERLEHAVDSETRKCLSLRFHLYDERRPTGAIRGALTDAILTASHRAGIGDPILVSQTNERLTSNEHYATIVREAFRADPRLDAVTGPVFHGHATDGRTFVGGAAPELLLGNRVIDGFRAAVRAGVVLGRPFVNLEASNSAFRMAALCAAGGYDTTALVGEDDRISVALSGMRRASGSLESRHVAYVDDLWLATDPRRELGAILAGHAIRESWRHEPPEEHVGSSMTATDLLHAYRNRPMLLQLDEVRAASMGDASAVARVHARTRAVFWAAIESLRLNSSDRRLSSLAHIANVYGLRDLPFELHDDQANAGNISDSLQAAFDRLGQVGRMRRRRAGILAR